MKEIITLNRLGRLKQFYMRGYQTIGAGIILINTIAIWFGLLPFVKDLFGNIFTFSIIFIPLYLVAMILFGRWDMKRGLYAGELLTGAYHSPNWQITIWMLVQANWSNIEALKFIEPYIKDESHRKQVHNRIGELKNEETEPSKTTSQI